MRAAAKGIVIAGGASGLGLGTVEMLAARGARIAIIDAAREVLQMRVWEITVLGTMHRSCFMQIAAVAP